MLTTAPEATRSLAGVDDARLERLPPIYAEFLRLQAAGVHADDIARALAIPSEALPLLADLAHRKLAAEEKGPVAPS